MSSEVLEHPTNNYDQLTASRSAPLDIHYCIPDGQPTADNNFDTGPEGPELEG